MGEAYWIRRLLVDAFANISSPKMCPYCDPPPGWEGQAIHADGVTCGSPACKRRAGEGE